MKKLLLTILIVCFATSSVFAASTQRFKSMRSSAMGGTGVASGNDIGVMYMNPALMESIDGHLHFISAKIAVDQNTIDDSDRAMDFFDDLDGNKTEAQMLDDMKAVVPIRIKSKLSLGLPLQFVGSAPPIINKFAHKFGIGAYDDIFIGAKMVDPQNPELKLDFKSDAALIFAISNELEAGLIPFDMNYGVGLKFVSQTTPVFEGKSFKALELKDMDGTDSIMDEIGTSTAQGFGFDLGMTTEVDIPFGIEEGKFGLILRDVYSSLDVDNSTGNNTSDTDSIPMSATIGFAGNLSMELPLPIVKNLLKDTIVAVDYDIISEDVSQFKRIHMGIEKPLFGKLVKARLGMHQGNITYGFSLDVWAAHFSYANFTDERGRKVGIEPEEYQIVELGFYF